MITKVKISTLVSVLNFLTEMLSVLGSEDITMKMSQPNRPGIVEPVDGLDENEHILMLSMPVIGM